jgi:hypothetical protein
MRQAAVCLLAATLAVGLGTGKAAAAKKGKRAASAAVVEHAASTEEVGKIKGAYKWGMAPEEVVELVHKAIEEHYAEPLKKSVNDPGKQDRIRAQIREEMNGVKKSYIDFQGDKTGWDVSIVDKEFFHNSGESMLVAQDEQWKRYFFFFEKKLYKMYLAFDKERLKDKTFAQFGEDMQKKFGPARLVMRDEKGKGGVKKVPDYYLWSSMNADSLKLVDRSTFYGVYCLVLYDSGTEDRVTERRKVVAPAADEKESLVDAVTAKGDERDSNDNIIDRITGKAVGKPGDEAKHEDIVVPRVRAPTAAEVNAGAGPAKEKKGGAKGKKGKEEKGKPEGLGDGIEL